MFKPFDSLQRGIEFQVVINHEEQYSLWPTDVEPPKGWKPTGTRGSLERCTEHLTGMTRLDPPLLASLQKEMASQARIKLSEKG